MIFFIFYHSKFGQKTLEIPLLKLSVKQAFSNRFLFIVTVIPIALKSMVNSYVQRLEFRLESWPEDGIKIKDPHNEYMIYVVLPSVIGTYLSRYQLHKCP